MKKGVIVLLQAGVVLIGLIAIALLLWEPQIEGRNAQATFFQIYFTDPFLAYAYVASVPFFVILYQAFKLLGCAARNTLFSQDALKALRTIKYCAGAMIGFVAGGEIFLRLQASDDRAGGIFIGAVTALSAMLMAGAAALTGRFLQKAISQAHAQ